MWKRYGRWLPVWNSVGMSRTWHCRAKGLGAGAYMGVSLHIPAYCSGGSSCLEVRGGVWERRWGVVPKGRGADQTDEW